MALNSIEKEWQRFSDMVFHKVTPSPVQITEMRKAFFAGAWSMFTSIEEIGEPHISEADGYKHLDNIKEECQAFQRELIKEYGSRN